MTNPIEPEQINWIDTDAVCKITGYAKSTLRNMRCKFPHMKFPEHRKTGRKLEWKEHEVIAWHEANPKHLRRERAQERAAENKIANNEQRREQAEAEREIDPFNAGCIAFMRGDYDAAWQRQTRTRP